MEGHLLMSAKERTRLKTMERIKQKEIKLKDAACLLKLSYRQTRRIYQRYRCEGDQGLIHQSRGKPSNRQYNAELRQQVLSLYRTKYPDFGPTLASEKLAEEKYCVDHETLRRWLLAKGLWQKRRKHPKHRNWREKKAHFGELVQFDGSHHQWFEKRGEKCCLMNMVDDATGTTMSLLAHEETTEAAMRLLWQWLDKYGIPAALYTDRKNVYITEREPILEEQLKGELPLTQFGSACQKLGIEIIPASSPQAKGRVERSNGVYQDRLVKELRLKGIAEIETANKFLAAGYLDKLNRQFAKPAREAADYHRVVDKGLDLRTVFCWEELRTVGNDWTIRYKNRFFQIKKQSNLPPAKGKVTVCEHLDGTTHLVYRGREIEFVELPKRMVVRELPRVERVKYIPAKDHPWRRSFGIGNRI